LDSKNRFFENIALDFSEVRVAGDGEDHPHIALYPMDNIGYRQSLSILDIIWLVIGSPQLSGLDRFDPQQILALRERPLHFFSTKNQNNNHNQND